MKLKTILFTCSLVVMSTTKGANAADARGANVNLNEPTVSPQEIESLVGAKLRERANAVGRFGAGEDGLLWRTVHKVRSGTFLVGHVAKYPACAYAATPALYWYVNNGYANNNEIIYSIKSFIRENFTLVTGVLVAGGLFAGLYYGPKDHAVTEGYKKLTDDVTDHKYVAKNLAEEAIFYRKRGEQLQNLHGALGQVNAACVAAGTKLDGLKSEAEKTTKAVADAKQELAGVKDQTAQVVRSQQEARVVEFVRAIREIIQAEANHFERLKAIESDPSTARDASRLQVALSTTSGERLCNETLAQIYRNTTANRLPEDLQRLVDGLMESIRPHMDTLSDNRRRVDALRVALETQYRPALEDDARKMAALVAAAERRALPAPAASSNATIIEINDGDKAAEPMTVIQSTTFGQLGRSGGMILQNVFGPQVARPLPFAPSNGSQSVDVAPQGGGSLSVLTTPTVEEVD